MSEGTVISTLHTPVCLDYEASVGRNYERYLRALAEGRFVGGRCPSSGKVYVPPRAASPVTGRPADEPVALADRGVLTTFCIIRIPFEGQRLVPPYVFGAVVLDGADMPIYHLVSECPLEDIRMGMRVEAVWKPAEERGPTLESVLYFRPTGEPDASFETYGVHL